MVEAFEKSVSRSNCHELQAFEEFEMSSSSLLLFVVGVLSARSFRFEEDGESAILFEGGLSVSLDLETAVVSLSNERMLSRTELTLSKSIDSSSASALATVLEAMGLCCLGRGLVGRESAEGRHSLS